MTDKDGAQLFDMFFIKVEINLQCLADKNFLIFKQTYNFFPLRLELVSGNAAPHQAPTVAA